MYASVERRRGGMKRTERKRGQLRLRTLAMESGWTAPVFRRVKKTRKMHLSYKRQYFDEWTAQKQSSVSYLLMYWDVYRIWELKKVFRQYGHEHEFYRICGRPFTAKMVTEKYCSRKCAREAEIQKKRKREAEKHGKEWNEPEGVYGC